MKKLVAPDGTPILFKGQEIFVGELPGVVKEVNMEKRSMVMTGTDETVDRDGDIIRLSGWDLENYKVNPVFLWAHNYGSVPLARAEKVIKRREPARMDFYLLFPTKGIHPFADMILQLYSEMIINASSVGFIPKQWKDMEQPPPENQTDGVRNRRTWGREYLKQELLELSGCAVPANPNALQNALTGKGFNFKPEDMLKWLTGVTVVPRPEKSDDILEEITKTKTEIIDETTSPQVQVPDTVVPTPPPEEKKESEVVPLSETPPEEIKSTLVKIMVDEGDIKEIKSNLTTISQGITSLTELIKGFKVSQEKSNGKDQLGPEEKGGAASVILQEGFEQGKNKPQAPALNLEGLDELKKVAQDFRTLLKQINKK